MVQLAQAHRIQLWSNGFFRAPKVQYDKPTLGGQPIYYVTACCEVAIDALTARAACWSRTILHDAGHSINPAIDLGQIEGGFVQGMRWLLTEQLVWNNQGLITTHARAPTKSPPRETCRSTSN